jgi:hypothetical protein
LQSRHSPTPVGTIPLNDDDLHRLDTLLGHYRTAVQEGWSTSTQTLKLDWDSAEKQVHRETFIDFGFGGGHLAILREITDRASTEKELLEGRLVKH